MAENKSMDIVEKPTKNETVCEKRRGNCSGKVTIAPRR